MSSSTDNQTCLAASENGPIGFSSRQDKEIYKEEVIDEKAELFKRQYQIMRQQFPRPMHPDIPLNLQQHFHHQLQQQFLLGQHLHNARSPQESSPTMSDVTTPPPATPGPVEEIVKSADSALSNAGGRKRNSDVDVGYISDRSSSCSPKDNCQRPSHHHHNAVTPPLEKKMRVFEPAFGNSSTQVSLAPGDISPKSEFSPQLPTSVYSHTQTTACTTDTASNRSHSPKLEIEEDRPDSVPNVRHSPPLNRNVTSPLLPVPMPALPPLASFQQNFSGVNRSPEIFRALMSAAMQARSLAPGDVENVRPNPLLPPYRPNYPTHPPPQDLDPTKGGPPARPCSPPKLPPPPPRPRNGKVLELDEIQEGLSLNNPLGQITDPAIFMEVAKVDAESKGEFERFKMSIMQKFEEDKSKSSRRSSLDNQPLNITEEMLREGKDAAYYERRRKNNEAAKRSRDSRRQKEQEVAIRCQFLERENASLKYQLALARVQSNKDK